MGRKKPLNLHLAFARGKKIRIRNLVDLIEKCADVNTPDVYGKTPLHAAIQNKISPKIIKLLIAKGANVEAQDNGLCTPIHAAFYHDSKDSLILYLLGYVENVNITDAFQRTYLHLAISNRRYEKIVWTLISKGANLEALDSRGRTPLHTMINIGAFYIYYSIDYFLKNTRNVNSTDSERKQTLLHAAVETDCTVDVIKPLVEKGANMDALDEQGRTPLHLAFDLEYCNFTVEIGYTKYYTFTKHVEESFVYLIQNTRDINKLDLHGRTPLYYAFLREYPHPVIIQELVENGADFNCPDSSVFCLASDEERSPLLKYSFPEALEDLKTIVVSQQTTLYDALVLRRPHDWNCVDRPLECLTERNKPFWSVIMSSIVAQRSYSLRLHSEGIRLEEESTFHVISFLKNWDVINLLLAYRHCLHLKRRSDSSVSPSPTIKRREIIEM